VGDRRGASRLRAHALAAAAVLVTLLLSGCTGSGDVPTYPHGKTDESITDGSVLRTVVLYVVIPLAIVALISALSWLPGVRRGTRYRPQFGWTAAPVWFAGPPDAVSAVQSAEVGDVRRGGAGGSW
jgi:hypothetical protein